MNAELVIKSQTQETAKAPEKVIPMPPPGRAPETWSRSREAELADEKELMGQHFATDDWLVRDTDNPESSPRIPVASAFVNQGTSPRVVVGKALDWIAKNSGNRVYHVTWYSPGALVPATLHDFRENNPQFAAATGVHLFPGEVDLALQAMMSKEAQEYARNITRCFQYMLLSAYSFDLETGTVLFLFDREVPMQRICARLKAVHKYLFLDSGKFTGEGEVGYGIQDLLETATQSVTIYTVTSTADEKILTAFDRLARTFLSQNNPIAERARLKNLRLTIVGTGSKRTQVIAREGYFTALPDR